MKHKLIPPSAILVCLLITAGCTTTGPTVTKPPEQGLGLGKVPYEVSIETSEPSSRIEVTGDSVGISPITVTIFGDRDGTFHGEGDGYTVFKAYPVRPGQYPQVKRYLNGAQDFMFGQQDRIPKKIYFDLNQKPEGLEIIALK